MSVVVRIDEEMWAFGLWSRGTRIWWFVDLCGLLLFFMGGLGVG